MKPFKIGCLLFLLMYTPGVRADSTDKAIDLGTTSVASSIRRPTAELVESSDPLRKAAGKLLKAEYERIEKDQLSKIGATQ